MVRKIGYRHFQAFLLYLLVVLQLEQFNGSRCRFTPFPCGKYWIEEGRVIGDDKANI